MQEREPATGTGATLAVLVMAGVGLVATYLVPFDRDRTRTLAADVAPLVTTLVAGIAILRSRRSERAWRSAGFLGVAVLGVAVVNAAIFVGDLTRTSFGPSALDLAFVPIGLLFLIPVKIEFDNHLPKGDRGEIATDVALIAAALSMIVYVVLRPPGADATTSISAAILATLAASGFTAYGAFAIWVPSR